MDVPQGFWLSCRILKPAPALVLLIAAAGATAQSSPSLVPCKMFSLDHVYTFDGGQFDVNTAGTFMLVESNALSVQVTTGQRDSSNAHTFAPTMIMVRYGSNVFRFNAQGLLTIAGYSNGATTTQSGTPNTNGFSGTIKMSNGSIVQANTDILVAGAWAYDVTVELPASAKGTVSGLCGNFNGNPSDDNLSSSGHAEIFGPPLVWLPDGTNLAKTWVPPDNKNLFLCGGSGAGCAGYQGANYQTPATPAPAPAPPPAPIPVSSPAPPANPAPTPAPDMGTTPGEKACNEYLTRNNVPTPSGPGGTERVMAPIRPVVRVEACKGLTTLKDAAVRIACMGQAFARNMIPMQAAGYCSTSPNLPGIAAATWPPKEPPAWANPEPKDGPVSQSPAPAACDAPKESACEALVQDQIPWKLSNTQDPATRHWTAQNLKALCGCTTNPPATVLCFQNALYNNGHTSTWQAAIAACKAH